MFTKRHIARFALYIGLLLPATMQAQRWTTHFAYNNVTQIAMAPDKVYAVSDGSLFSVDKQTERIRIYNNQSGLHGTGITCIHYDEKGKQLIIAYGTGKLDVMSEKGVKYISELYEKDMTQRKNIYNVTIHGRTAYLSTHYGVQTMDLRENKLVDSYWLRPNGEETPVQDVLIANDSIYAFTADSLFCAALTNNLADYTYWKREQRSGRIAPDVNKGVYYQDTSGQWYAGHADGIVRQTFTEKISYMPEGPLNNTPYRLATAQNQVWVVPGGRWAGQYDKPGVVMHYDGSHWTNIQQSAIAAKTGKPVLDFMNVAVDPRDIHHYYVTSYGTGLYEFDHDTLVRHFIAGEGNTMIPAANDALRYTRIDNAIFDTDGNLWFLDASSRSQIQCVDVSGQWHAVTLMDGDKQFSIYTPANLVLDNNNPNYKWFATARVNTCVGLLDDGGTRFDEADDKVLIRSQWTNRNGQAFKPEQLYDMMQDREGRIWLATDKGVAYIDSRTDFFSSDDITQPDVMDNNGENPLTSMIIQALCQSADGQIWVGTQGMGVYVLNSYATEIIAHYTTDNSALPSNTILSLACTVGGVLYIGSAEGLVAFDPNSTPTEGISSRDNESSDLEQGSMQQWRLHLSYNNAVEAAATPQHVYAVANGSLFSYNRQDGTLEYWSRASGLHGSTITHIAYDASSGYLIIAYQDGRIDLMNDNGEVKQMPDIYMKAGSIAVTVNSIFVGSRYTYLAMPFGIVAIQPGKAEVSGTYYIGDEAASLDVLQVVEKGDSLYAFTEDRMYSAAMADNVVDYHFWHESALPVSQLQNVLLHRNDIYTVQHDTLYLLQNNAWKQVIPQAVRWAHASGGQLLVGIGNFGLYRLADDGTLAGLCDRYVTNDAVYSQGEYWLCEQNWGLIRLGSAGDDYFHTDGPNTNFGYQLFAAHDRIYAASGGRWAGEFARSARLNIYDGLNWKGINEGDFSAQVGVWVRDLVSIAVDPTDAEHYYAATYGSGVFEINHGTITRYTTGNSTLQPATATIDPLYYTRTDGAMIDEKGNLWVLNATSVGNPVHVMTPDKQWHSLSLVSGGQSIRFTTPYGTWVDRRSPQRKWFMDQRNEPGLILLDDGGTPTYGGDDKCIKRASFVDQNGNTITPAAFRCFAQDHTNRIWIGTQNGIITIPSSVDFFTSNACKRIIIPRNDGTNLGDYLLGDEQINCIAVDGGNRIWIGTANSGLYLMEDDTITVAHFTENNSLLPSNSILSIAIMPTTGEVFVGTDGGIASYRSDASEAAEEMSHVYAYPNPVRPDYGGMISIAGLMDNTVVNIVDAGGNLVCKTRSHGGTAVWDGRLQDGRRATPGVYTALCNAEGGKAVIKILVVR